MRKRRRGKNRKNGLTAAGPRTSANRRAEIWRGINGSLVRWRRHARRRRWRRKFREPIVRLRAARVVANVNRRVQRQFDGLIRRYGRLHLLRNQIPAFRSSRYGAIRDYRLAPLQRNFFAGPKHPAAHAIRQVHGTLLVQFGDSRVFEPEPGVRGGDDRVARNRRFQFGRVSHAAGNHGIGVHDPCGAPAAGLPGCGGSLRPRRIGRRSSVRASVLFALPEIGASEE